MACGDFKDLSRRTAVDKLLRDKALNIAKNLKLHKLLQKHQKLHKLIIRKSDKRKVYSTFTGNIWGADLADMQLISKFN